MCNYFARTCIRSIDCAFSAAFRQKHTQFPARFHKPAQISSCFSFAAAKKSPATVWKRNEKSDRYGNVYIIWRYIKKARMQSGNHFCLNHLFVHLSRGWHNFARLVRCLEFVYFYALTLFQGEFPFYRIIKARNSEALVRFRVSTLINNDGGIKFKTNEKRPSTCKI